jgi:hypothetical protein
MMHIKRLVLVLGSAGLLCAATLAIPYQTTEAAFRSSSGSIVHYLYAEAGTCPDAINVFKVSGSSLTLVSNIAVGCEDGGDFGGHRLRRTPRTKTGPACLFLASDGNNGVGAAVSSLAINSITGGLSLVSTVAGGNNPTDLLVMGRKLVETSPPSPTSSLMAFNAYAIHNNCSLGLLKSTPMVSEVISIAGLSTSEFVAPFYGGSIGTYKLNQSTGAITLVSVAAAQTSDLDSATAQTVQTSTGPVTNVFIGQASDGPPQVEAAQMTATGSVLPFAGSPATDGDTTARDGVGVLVSGSTLYELNNTSNQLAWYGLTAGTPGTSGKIAYGGDIGLIGLATGGSTGTPTQMSVLGTTLFVAEGPGAVDACQIGAPGVLSCAVAATLSPAYGSSPSVID